MRVIADHVRCEGNGAGLGLAPGGFELDDDDVAVVKTDPIPTGQEQFAEQPIADCPRAVLSRRN